MVAFEVEVFGVVSGSAVVVAVPVLNDLVINVVVVVGDAVVMSSVVVVDGSVVVVVDVAIDVIVVSSVVVVIAVVVVGSGGNVAFKSENRARNSINSKTMLR